MKKILLTILVLYCTLLLDSCRKEIAFNGDEYPPRLVINSLIRPGEPVVAELGKTYFFLDQDELIDTSVPDGLQVDLYVNGQHVGALEHSFDTVEQYGYHSILRQYYTNNYIPTEDDVIKINATAPGFEDVEATTSPIPQKPQCAIVDVILFDHFEISQNDEEAEMPWFFLKKFALLTLEITDTEPGTTNYFCLPAYFDFKGYDENLPDVDISFRPSLEDPIFENYNSTFNESMFDFYPYKDYAFTDAMFDGGSYRIQIPIDLFVNNFSINNMKQLQPKILLPVQQFTKEYYHYLCSVSYVMEQIQLLVEPSQTYSNVKGGYGIVGGINSETLVCPVPVPNHVKR